jgi:superfamily II DNA/RNA helicase
VIENFDAKARFPKDDYRILISTEVLSEGVNLHRSNVVVNYDIPWNPTRMMQRVGRINRVDTKFDKIYTYNFFPTGQANREIGLKEAAEAKINAFITLLGADARLLTDGEEITSYELFDRLTSSKTVTGEDETEETELKYLNVIKNIRDKDKDLFEKIKRLPKKARTARFNGDQTGALITYFRKAKIQKFFLANEDPEAQELDFMTSAKLLESETGTPRQKLAESYFDLLDKNKRAFDFATATDLPDKETRRGRDSATKLLFIIKASMKDRRQFTDDQEQYLRQLTIQLEEGGIPKQTANKAFKAVQDAIQKEVSPLKILGLLRKNIPDKFLTGHFAESGTKIAGKREVILSEYFTGE